MQNKNFSNPINQGSMSNNMGGNTGGNMNNNQNYSQHSDGNQNQNQKKVPNPANFKIVKCKNFDKGRLNFLYFKYLL